LEGEQIKGSRSLPDSKKLEGKKAPSGGGAKSAEEPRRGAHVGPVSSNGIPGGTDLNIERGRWEGPFLAAVSSGVSLKKKFVKASEKANQDSHA